MKDVKEMIKGKGAVGIAIAYFSLHGIVSIPTDHTEYNLIYDNGKKLSKIKVISCSFKTKFGVYSATIRTSGGNQPTTQVKKFDPRSCDMVFVVTADMEMYNIPSSDITSTRQISMKVYEPYRVTFIPS